jgi:2-polyprenyl-3-methyl-5-hydroxy-6-metoxy-1,4-benzoquinol methylase
MSKEIPGDYQYKALTKGFYIQQNWHKSKLKVFDSLNLGNTKHTAVDIGCGSGNFIYHSYRVFNKIIAIDNNRDALNFINKNISKKNITNVSTFFYDLVKKNNIEIPQADVAVCTEVLEHFHQDILETTVISNISKLIKNNGLLFITTPNTLSFWPLIEKILDMFHLVPHLSGEQHFSTFTKDAVKQILEKNGFEIIQIGTFNHVSPYIPFEKIRNLFLSVESRRLKKFGPIMYVLARKRSKNK